MLPQMAMWLNCTDGREAISDIKGTQVCFLLRFIHERVFAPKFSENNMFHSPAVYRLFKIIILCRNVYDVWTKHKEIWVVDIYYLTQERFQPSLLHHIGLISRTL